MLKKVLSIGAKWIDGKWVKSAVAEATESSPKALQNGKVYTKMKFATKPVVKKVTQTRLPEGMFPDEMTAVDLRKLFNDRYRTIRYGDKTKLRSATPEQTNKFYSSIKAESDGILIDDEVDWIYRKPSSITDRIQSFSVIPRERVSMNINAESELISALDRYIANGEVLVNGKVIKNVKPPKAYYKVDTGLDEAGSFWSRTDPITMYFRENATPEQLSDIAQITRQFSCSTPVNFPSGSLKGANWLSHAKEHSPEDLYQLYKRALKIDPKLAEAIEIKITKSGYGRLAGVDYGRKMPYIERYRYRISEGQYLAIESVVNDYEKALGKVGFDRMM